MTKLELQKMNNEEFISYCMNYSKYGALCQMAVIQCLEQGIKHYANNPMKPDENTFVSPSGWNGAINELNARFKEKYLNS